ncbi:MAG: helix-hairpin-helix domain-containing protein [Sphingobacteriales bacterium]|nr:helix-hairpin-helix domain-containing protein [Sphingobacteriales bacterium]
MKHKEWISDYFTLSRKERIGVFLILLLVALAFCLPSFLPGRRASSRTSTADTAWIAAMKRLEKKQADPGRAYPEENSRQYPYDRAENYRQKRPEGRLFEFNPNTISPDGWQELGLREKTIKTILNFLSKGGRFRKPEDLQRIYGLFPDEYERLRPYIRIAEERPAATASRANDRMFTERPAPATGPATVEINSADTASFIALPGIGSKLAQRIIHFRGKLGGFYSINQVAETFGLSDSVFRRIQPYLRLEVMTLRKININTATAEELKVHPYLKWNLINALLAYRKEHGPFRRKEELKQVMAVTDEIYEQIAPYLVTE